MQRVLEVTSTAERLRFAILRMRLLTGRQLALTYTLTIPHPYPYQPCLSNPTVTLTMRLLTGRQLTPGG